MEEEDKQYLLQAILDVINSLDRFSQSRDANVDYQELMLKLDFLQPILVFHERSLELMFSHNRFMSRVGVLSLKPFFYNPTTNAKPIILSFLVKSFCRLKPSAWIIVDITKFLFNNKFLIFHSFILTSKYITTPISSSLMFESIVNVKLLNNPLFIGVVLPMLPKYDTAELRF